MRYCTRERRCVQCRHESGDGDTHAQRCRSRCSRSRFRSPVPSATSPPPCAPGPPPRPATEKTRQARTRGPTPIRDHATGEVRPASAQLHAPCLPALRESPALGCSVPTEPLPGRKLTTAHHVVHDSPLDQPAAPAASPQRPNRPGCGRPSATMTRASLRARRRCAARARPHAATAAARQSTGASGRRARAHLEHFAHSLLCRLEKTLQRTLQAAAGHETGWSKACPRRPSPQRRPGRDKWFFP